MLFHKSIVQYIEFLATLMTTRSVYSKGQGLFYSKCLKLEQTNSVNLHNMKREIPVCCKITSMCYVTFLSISVLWFCIKCSAASNLSLVRTNCQSSLFIKTLDLPKIVFRQMKQLLIFCLLTLVSSGTYFQLQYIDICILLLVMHYN